MDPVKAMLAALRETYIRDLAATLDELEDVLLHLEREGYVLETAQDIFRRVHSLKGSGGTHGLHRITDTCHQFEDLLSQVMAQPERCTRPFFEAALAYVDLLRQLRALYHAHQEPGPDIARALEALRQRCSGTRYAALIVENSEVVVNLLRDVLKAQDFRVDTALDGLSALGRLLAEPYDLLISGVEIRRLNGLALIAAVQRAGGRVSRTRTILLTSTRLPSGKDLPDGVIHKDALLKEHVRDTVLRLFPGSPQEDVKQRAT